VGSLPTKYATFGYRPKMIHWVPITSAFVPAMDAVDSGGRKSMQAGPRSEEVGFAHDSALEGRVHCELVSEIRRRFR